MIVSCGPSSTVEWDDEKIISETLSAVALYQVLIDGVGVATAWSVFSNIRRRNIVRLATDLTTMLVAAVEENMPVINELDSLVQPWSRCIRRPSISLAAAIKRQDCITYAERVYFCYLSPTGAIGSTENHETHLPPAPRKHLVPLN